MTLFICFFLFGCTHEKSNDESPFDITGIIKEVDFEKSGILVEEKNNNLIWVYTEETETLEEYKEGQEVLVWIEGSIAESAPSIAKAVKVNIVEAHNWAIWLALSAKWEWG